MSKDKCLDFSSVLVPLMLAVHQGILAGDGNCMAQALIL